MAPRRTPGTLVAVALALIALAFRAPAARAVQFASPPARVRPAVAEPVPDLWLRRVALDLTARLPSPAMRARLARSDDAKTRGAIVDELLGTPAYARRWGKLLAAPLVTPDRDLAYLARRVEAFLAEALAQRRPWNQIAAELVTAEGSVDERPAAAFLLQYIEARSEVAYRVGTGLLGVRIGCAQCHDHPFARWTVADFHGLAAWFARTRRLSLPRELYHVYRQGRAGALASVDIVLPRGKAGQITPGQLQRIGRDIATLNRHAIGAPVRPTRHMEMEVYAKRETGMAPAGRVTDLASTVPILIEEGTNELPVPELPELPAALTVTLADPAAPRPRSMAPRLPGGAPAARSAGPRRAVLSRWLTARDNPFLAKALVNRVSAHLFGRGLVEPVDAVDSPDDGAHAARLAELSAAFAADGWDVARLIRRIVLAPEYAGRAEPRPSVRPLDAMQVAGALASGLGLSDAEGLERALARNATARADDVPTAGQELPILDLPRALFLLGGELGGSLDRAPRAAEWSRLAGPARLDALFGALLARAPTAAERARFGAAPVPDLVWSIVASAEFLTNH